jgi:hypothetical protein
MCAAPNAVPSIPIPTPRHTTPMPVPANETPHALIPEGPRRRRVEAWFCLKSRNQSFKKEHTPPMAKVAPMTEQFQHFLEEERVSGGRCRGGRNSCGRSGWRPTSKSPISNDIRVNGFLPGWWRSSSSKDRNRRCDGGGGSSKPNGGDGLASAVPLPRRVQKLLRPTS